MNLYEIEDEMRRLAASESKDTEGDHVRADELLVEALLIASEHLPPFNGRTAQSIVANYRIMDKWYA